MGATQNLPHSYRDYIWYLRPPKSTPTSQNVMYRIFHNYTYLRRVFLPPQSLVLANIHSITAHDVPGTEDVGLHTKFLYNVGSELQPIAGSMPINRLRRWPNTNLSPGLLCTLLKHVAFNQCCFNVDPQSSTLARHWNSIGWLYRVFRRLHYAGDALTARGQKHQITRYIGPMQM